MWENVNEFPKTKRRKYPQYTSEWGFVIMCKSNRPFIPANEYSEFISLQSFAGMNGLLELRIITQPYSEVNWVYMYFRHVVFGNSLTKHNKLSSFSYSVVIFSSRFPTYRLCIMLNLPISHVCLSPWVGLPPCSHSRSRCTPRSGNRRKSGSRSVNRH